MRVAALAVGLGLIVLAAVDGSRTAAPRPYPESDIASPASVPESPFLITNREQVLSPVVQPNQAAPAEIAPAPLADPVQTAPDTWKPPRDRAEAQIRPAQNSAGQIWDGRCNGGPLLYGKIPVPDCPLAPGPIGSTSIRTPASGPLPRR